jgi:hypothetical protein
MRGWYAANAGMYRRGQDLIGNAICFLFINVSWLVNLEVGLQIEPPFLATFPAVACLGLAFRRRRTCAAGVCQAPKPNPTGFVPAGLCGPVCAEPSLMGTLLRRYRLRKAGLPLRLPFLSLQEQTSETSQPGAQASGFSRGISQAFSNSLTTELLLGP